MANRSDRKSILPRQLKRMLALQSTGDPHKDGVTRRCFIEAHKHYMVVWPKLPLHKHSDLDGPINGESNSPNQSKLVAQAESAVQS